MSLNGYGTLFGVLSVRHNIPKKNKTLPKGVRISTHWPYMTTAAYEEGRKWKLHGYSFSMNLGTFIGIKYFLLL